VFAQVRDDLGILLRRLFLVLLLEAARVGAGVPRSPAMGWLQVLGHVDAAGAAFIIVRWRRHSTQKPQNPQAVDPSCLCEFREFCVDRRRSGE